MKRVLSSLLLILLLLCGLTDRAEAAVTPLQKTASGSSGENPNKRAYFDPLLVVEMQRDRELWGYDVVLDVDVGPNLYAYVRQNPWTAFDPLGLQLSVTGGAVVYKGNTYSNENFDSMVATGKVQLTRTEASSLINGRSLQAPPPKPSTGDKIMGGVKAVAAFVAALTTESSAVRGEAANVQSETQVLFGGEEFTDSQKRAYAESAETVANLISKKGKSSQASSGGRRNSRGSRRIDLDNLQKEAQIDYKIGSGKFDLNSVDMNAVSGIMKGGEILKISHPMKGHPQIAKELGIKLEDGKLPDGYEGFIVGKYSNGISVHGSGLNRSDGNVSESARETLTKIFE